MVTLRWPGSLLHRPCAASTGQCAAAARGSMSDEAVPHRVRTAVLNALDLEALPAGRWAVSRASSRGSAGCQARTRSPALRRSGRSCSASTERPRSCTHSYHQGMYSQSLQASQQPVCAPEWVHVLVQQAVATGALRVQRASGLSASTQRACGGSGRTSEVPKLGSPGLSPSGSPP